MTLGASSVRFNDLKLREPTEHPNADLPNQGHFQTPTHDRAWLPSNEVLGLHSQSTGQPSLRTTATQALRCRLALSDSHVANLQVD